MSVPAMEFRTSPGFTTLVETLRWRAEHEPGRLAYRFLPDGEGREEAVTYGQLGQRVRAIAGILRSLQHRGDRALLIYPPGLEFIAAFLGCLHAGTLAVVLAPPSPARLPQFLARLGAVARDATPSVALTTSGIRDLLVAHLAPHEAPGPARWLATEGLDEAAAPAWSGPAPAATDLAFLQYTSGSTTEPKGVMVSHGNLLDNLRLIEDSFAQQPGTASVSWLPPHHDMGLVGGILAPLHLGTPATLLPPVAFVQRPVRWLQAISRHRATVSGGPNFAYEHCLRRVTPEQCAGLDLGCWEVAFCGAEPISPRTLQAFADRFAPFGFQLRSLKACYGLAESTLMVAAGPSRSPPVVRSFRASELAHNRAVPCAADVAPGAVIPSCGRPGQEVAIVDATALTERPPGWIGEIWVSGLSVALGYWNRPAETAAAFRGRIDGREPSFLRTGDLGFLLDGELYVTGRLKDLIIVDGANHYPQDIERTVAGCDPALGSAECAAFQVEIGNRAEVVVVVSPGRGSGLRPEAVKGAIRAAVAAQHDIRLHDIVLVKPGRIPRTTSGKIRRGACGSGYLAGTLDPRGEQ
jgi:acyl-CoA synthetase (AMP-forming)/AMP-acid ligase II